MQLYHIARISMLYKYYSNICYVLEAAYYNQIVSVLIQDHICYDVCLSLHFWGVIKTLSVLQGQQQEEWSKICIFIC